MTRRISGLLAIFLFYAWTGAAYATTVGYWRFEEGVANAQITGANSVLDQSGNSQNGSPSGNPFYRDEVPVNPIPRTGATNTLSAEFDGIGDFVTIANTATLNPMSAFSVEFWMRADAASGNTQRLVVDKSHGFVDSTGWAFQILAGSGSMAFNIGTGGGGIGSFPGIFSTTSVLDNEWHHIAGTYDSLDVGQQLKLYIDGDLEGTLATAPYVSNLRDINIGAACVFTGCPTGPHRFYDGLVDELRISDAALTSSQFLNAVPIPGAAWLFGSALLALLGVAKRKKA